jgi:YaiO family outer membrane protein
MCNNRLLFVLLVLTISATCYAQDWTQLSGDELFALARKTAFQGNRKEARLMLERVLQQTPDYHEVRVFMARTFYWDGQFEEAKSQLQDVLAREPGNAEAIDLFADVLLAEEHWQQVIDICNEGLINHPTSEELLYKKALALVRLGKNDEAGAVLASLLSINRSHEKAIKLTSEIKSMALKNSVGISYGIDVFNRTFRPAHYLSAQLTRRERFGDGILRVNYANRFSTSGVQGEIDLYPKFTNGVYAYLNYGYSSSPLFPAHRLGAEVYSKLPRGAEASLGVRYLKFEGGNNVAIYTASASLYYKNYLFSFRPFLAPSVSGNSFFSVVNARRYLNDGENYLGVSGGFGFSPDEARLQSARGLSSDAVFRLRAQKVWINWQKTLERNFITLINIGLVRQELSFNVGNYVWMTNLSVSVRKRY